MHPARPPLRLSHASHPNTTKPNLRVVHAGRINPCDAPFRAKMTHETEPTKPPEPDHGVPEPPADKDGESHDTLKYHLLGPSLTKAGQDSVDQTKVRPASHPSRPSLTAPGFRDHL